MTDTKKVSAPVKASAKPAKKRPQTPRENVFVDYIHGTPEQITEALSRKVGTKGYNSRIRDLLVSVAIAMTWSRDNAGAHVGPRVLSSLLDIATLHSIINRQHKDFVRAPDSVLAGIRHYLGGLSGYDPVQGANQSGLTISNHTFQEQKAVEVLRSGAPKRNTERKPRNDKAGKSVSLRGRPEKKDVKKTPSKKVERDTVVDKVNGFVIRKKAVIADNKQVSATFTVVVSNDNLKNFNSLGEARDFAKEYKAEVA